MAGNQRAYKHRTRSTQTLQKVFRAMELVASSRIGQARHNAQEASPCDHALGQTVAVLRTCSRFEHPIIQECTDTKRMAILAVTSDRDMVDAYSATILHETGRLIKELVKEGKESVIFIFGRHAWNYLSFQDTSIEFSWAGQSGHPSDEAIEEVATTLLDYFLQPTEAGGVTEVYIAFTRYVPTISQVPEVRRMLPFKVVDIAGADELDNAGNEALEKELEVKRGSSMSLYKFEPGPSEVFDALLTRYMGLRIRNTLLQSAVSELAGRQQAMHTVTGNAEDLIITHTRLANTAHQGDITQEITEIISGADALGTE